MSGNMSFSKVRNSTLLNTTNAVPLMTLEDFSARNTSHVPSVPAPPTYQEADLWTFRIILSSLQEVAFSNQQNSKISPQLLRSIQNALINIKTEFDPKNPFLKEYHQSVSEVGPSRNQDVPLELGTSARCDAMIGLESSSNDLAKSYVGGHGSAGTLTVPSSLRLVIRSLVAIQVRELAKGIIKMYGPLMDKAELKLSSTMGGAAPLRTDPVADESNIQEALSGINSLLEKLKTDGQILDSEIEDLKTEREMEFQTYKRQIQEVQGIVSQLTELTVIEHQPDRTACYLDHLKQANEQLALKQEILEIEKDIESNPPELVRELEVYYNKLKAAVDDLEKKNAEVKNKIFEYQSLGPDFIAVLQEFRSLAEEIKTKEWVHDQLTNGAWDKSLSDSFF